MKKTLAIFIVALVLTTIGVLGYSIYNTFTESEQVRKRIAELPELNVVTLIDNHIESHQEQPIIVNYFNSNCQFCRAEIESIRQHGNLSKEAYILFISDESKRRIELFSESVGLDTSTVSVAWDSAGIAKQFFGVKQVPVTFVYQADRSIIDSFKGEVKANVLYDSIK